MCNRWPMSSHTRSWETSECLWIRPQSRVKACLHSQCYSNLWWTWDKSTCSLLNQPDIEMKVKDHHLLCLVQCWMNGVLINEVPKFLTTIPSETMHVIQVENPFDATHTILTPSKLNRVTNDFNVKKLTGEEYEDESILKIELTAEVSLWNLSSPEFSRQEQTLFSYKEWIVSPNTPAWGQLSLSYDMLMMLQMLWMTKTMPLCWKVLSIYHHCN